MRLLTLGALRLEGSGSKFRRTKSLLLLAYLALEGPKARRELAERFFLETHDPRDSLSAALAKLKKAVPDAFDTNTDRVWTELECDAKELLSYLEKGDPKALELYQGAFLEGLDLSLGEELEDWLFSTREYLAAQVRERYLQEAEKELAKDVTKAGQHAERAYSLVGAPELNPEDFQRVYYLLTLARNPLSAKVLEEAKAYGIEINPEESKVQEQIAEKLERRTQLPQPTNSFVGRDQERLAIADLLSEAYCRLITLHGPGGVGKTRLAIQAAYDQLNEGRFKDGLFFVPLEALGSDEQIPMGIANVLDLKLTAETEPLTQVIHHLAQKDILLVLDNFEQLMDAVMLPSELLASCPRLKLLITSRERLHIAEEHVLNLKGLALPDAFSKAEDLVHNEAIQLFVHRAKKSSLAFQLDAATLPLVVNLVQLLEGYPLAIELAVAWVRILPLSEISQEIEKNLNFLSSDTANTVDRHKSIRAAFDYSWQLLSPKDQELLSRLSVFKAGFTREAASIVADANLGSLVSLVDKSLLRVSSKGRFDVHALLHQFLQEKLTAQATLEAQTQKTHATHFLAFAEETRPKLYTSEQAIWMHRLDEEHENLQSSIHWFLNHNEAIQALKLTGFIGQFWVVRGYFQQGRRWLERVLEHPDTQEASEFRAIALTQAGILATDQKDYLSGRTYFTEGLAIRRELGDKFSIGSSLLNLGIVSKKRLEYDAAQSLYQESLAIFRELEIPIGIASSLHNLGSLLKEQGDLESARSYLEDGLSIYENLGSKYGIIRSYLDLASIAQSLNDLSKAYRFYKKSLGVSQEIGNKLDIASSLEGLALVMAGTQGQLSVQLWAAAETIREIIQSPLTVQEYKAITVATASIRTDLGEESFLQTWEQGKAMPLERAIDLALSNK